MRFGSAIIYFPARDIQATISMQRLLTAFDYMGKAIVEATRVRQGLPMAVAHIRLGFLQR